MISAKVTDTDRGYAKIVREFATAAKDYTVLAGVIGTRAESRKIQRIKSGENPDTKTSKYNVAQIATVLEYGSNNGRIPARPFLRNPFDANKAKYQTRITKAAKSSKSTVLGVQSAVYKAAEFYVADVQRGINAQNFVPLAKYTVDRKGDSFILVDLGQLRQSIGTRIIGGAEKYSGRKK